MRVGFPDGNVIAGQSIVEERLQEMIGAYENYRPDIKAIFYL
jgi:hypothetical protein